MRNIWSNAGLALVLATSPIAATADSGSRAQPANSDQVSVPTIPGWNEFADRLKALAPKMLSKLPEEMQRDPHVQQEVARLMLESLAAGAMGAISQDPDRPVFLPSLNLTLNIGQPNADTAYKQARITPGGTYRLRGKIGNVRIAKIAQFGTSHKTAAGISMLGYYDLNSLPVDESGRYDVVISPVRPEGYAGQWWPLDPGTNALMLRLVSADWSNETDSTISIERLDSPAPKPRPSKATLERRLRSAPDEVDRMALLLVDHVAKLIEEGYVNRFKVFDVAQVGGNLVGQFYYETAYDIGEDEALIVEAKVPEQCGYYSMILTNAIYETTDWYNNHSSLNDSQLHIDDDGILRIVVSPRDPGIANWLDTAGYPSGAIQGRWTDCSAQPLPSIRKVKVSKVQNLLPANTPKVTPEEREQEIRDRRAILQQRNLW